MLSLTLLLPHTSIIMDIAIYIYSILQSNPMVMWIWGFNSPKALSNQEGLIFKVDGFKHKGWVKVVYDQGKDLFEVILLDNENNVLQRFEDVYIDCLIEIIDGAVDTD